MVRRAKIRLVLYFLMMLICLTFFQVSLKTAEIKIKVKTQLEIVETNQKVPQDVSIDDISVGKKLKLSIKTNSTNGNFQGNLKMAKHSGFAFLPYEASNMKINGTSVSKQSYTDFINGNGLNYLLDTSEKTMELEVVNSGNRGTTFFGELYFVMSDGSETTHRFDYQTSFTNTSFYNVNFFNDDGTLLSKQLIAKGFLAYMPMPKKEGYDFIGFNTQIDGQGEMFQNAPIKESKNYYAVYEKKVFKIEYYVENKLYDTQFVKYLEDAQVIKNPNIPNAVFLGWGEDLTSITFNKRVDGMFEYIKKEDISNKTFSFHLINGLRNDNLMKQKTHATIFDEKIDIKKVNQDFDKVDIKIFNEQENVDTLLKTWWVIPFVIIVVFVYRKLNKKINYRTYF